MALDTFIGGRYSGTYNSVDVGVTEDGYELQQDSMGELLNQTDAYGDSVIDWFYRGGNVYLQFNSKAFKAGSTTPFWPYGALGTMGVIGRLASAIASAMVLTATAGTPAAATPASLTGTLSILALNSPGRLLYTSKLRMVPVRLQLLAFDSGASVIKWFTTTALLMALTGLLASLGLA